MPYTMNDLEARAGVAPRTVREYIRRGLVAPPEKRGPGAEYDDGQLLRTIAVARLRARGEGWEAIKELLDGWSLGRVRAFVRKTEPESQPAALPRSEPPPPPPSPSPAAAPDPEAPVLEGEPVPPRAQLPGAGAPSDFRIERTAALDDAGIPDGRRYVFCPLLPGLMLLVSDDAAPLVRRVAAEIRDRYGTPRA
jgi:DNA-binding transcriptional MerR regulator